jgi:hypothetical protein
LRSAALAGEITAMLARAAAQALRFNDDMNELNMGSSRIFVAC